MKKTKRATLLDRMSAYFIDTLLLMFIYLGVWSGAQFLPKNNVLAYSNLIIIWIIFFAKDITGQSPGKMIMKIRIVKKSDNSRPHPIVSFIRNGLLILGIVEIPLILFDSQHERLGDKITSTIVVKD